MGLGTRLLLLTSAAISLMCAVAVLAWVIPTVRETWVPNTDGAEGAVPAFWGSVVGNGVYAGFVTLTALTPEAGRLIRGTVVVLSVGALLQALAYLDARAAFTNSPLRPEMQGAIDQLLLLAIAVGLGATIAVVALVADSLARHNGRSPT